MTPRRWSDVAIVALVTATVVALGVMACSGADVTPTASPTPTLVYHRPSPTTAAPTFSPTPLPTPNPSALAIRPCRAEDLFLRTGPPNFGAGHIWYIVGVSNASTTNCRIPIAPTVDMIDPNDDVLGTIGRGGDCGSLFPIFKTCQKRWSFSALAHHQRAARPSLRSSSHGANRAYPASRVTTTPCISPWNCPTTVAASNCRASQCRDVPAPVLMSSPHRTNQPTRPDPAPPLC